MTVIRPDGAKWVGVSGLSDIENNTAMAPGLKFRIASVAKTFTAVVILQLVQEGRLQNPIEVTCR
jgi:D-alanyl-D-alanine carboxypeptidase